MTGPNSLCTYHPTVQSSMFKRSYFIKAESIRNGVVNHSWSVVSWWSFFPNPTRIITEYVNRQEAQGHVDVNIITMRKL